MLLSIVVPVYNVDKYISPLLNILLPQITSDVEVIFVNDGSQDTSMQILNARVSEMMNLAENVVVINQKNLGISMARNNGINIAKGNFIAFIDSDDLIDSNYVYKILNILRDDKNIDILSFEATAIDESNENILWRINTTIPKGLYCDNRRFLKKVFKESSWQAWLRVFRKDIIKDLSFPQDALLEDIYYSVEAYLRASRIKHIKDSLVLYRQRDNSLVHTVNEKLIYGYEQVISFLRSIDDKTLASLSLNKIYLDYYIHLTSIYSFRETLSIMLKDNIPSIVIFKFIYFYIKMKGH
ncbi:glycosyltransferase family 2 protein [Acinetobacter nectaris]|uniref:glycosyltransferase family 2 protein n=1 Tax=Acinetobacter nectaris TaxID=1219382 RepID=UPI001F19F1D5|nr:glycosyltransferase [Acinetobacter nectaris]MCF9045707.1 glycosyltransferase [Acinetobacter nectaris]